MVRSINIAIERTEKEMHRTLTQHSEHRYANTQTDKLWSLLQVHRRANKCTVKNKIVPSTALSLMRKFWRCQSSPLKVAPLSTDLTIQ